MAGSYLRLPLFCNREALQIWYCALLYISFVCYLNVKTGCHPLLDLILLQAAGRPW